MSVEGTGKDKRIGGRTEVEQYKKKKTAKAERKRRKSKKVETE